jgi:DNA polymerase I-like protein with 3'-5' exonuclease and polymerase domains
MRAVMKQLRAQGLDARYGLFNQVHDALYFHFPEALLDEHARTIYPLLVAPSTILRNRMMPGGLWVDAEGKVGKNWAEMEAINTEGLCTLGSAPSPSLSCAPAPASPAIA